PLQTQNTNNATNINQNLKKINKFNPHKDTLYIKTIAKLQGFLPDTNTTGISKYEPTNINGIELTLQKTTVNWKFIVSGTHGQTNNLAFERPKQNIEIKLTNKTTGQKYTSTSNDSGIVRFENINITNPMFIMEYADKENPNKEYIDKFKIRIENDKGIVQNTETSDWQYQGKIIDVKNPQTFWMKDSTGWWAKALGDELPQITFDANKINEYFNQTKNIEIFLIENTYESNISTTFPDGKVRLNDPKLWEYYGSEYIGQFDKNKTLYWLMSNLQQHNNEPVSQDRLDDMIYVSNLNKSLWETSSLGAPYIKIEEKWYDNMQNNEIVNDPLNHQISFIYFSDDFGGLRYFENGYMHRSITELIYGLSLPTIDEEIIEPRANIEEGNNTTTSGLSWDFDNLDLKRHTSAGKILIKYTYILDNGENKIPK
ncbi:hypothetical protein K9M18_02530, partial [Candidatus Woesearchaeota archaeon]|nr:hypothetical protein [Candidatus Woesearchaeota archaeon]